MAHRVTVAQVSDDVLQMLASPKRHERCGESALGADTCEMAKGDEEGGWGGRIEIREEKEKRTEMGQVL